MKPTLTQRLTERLGTAADKLPLPADTVLGPFVAGVIAGAATFLTFVVIFFLWWAALSFVEGLIGPASDEVMLGTTAFVGLIILIVWAVLTQRVTRRVAGSADKPSDVGRAVGFIGTPIFLYVIISLGVGLVNVIRSVVGGR